MCKWCLTIGSLSLPRQPPPFCLCTSTIFRQETSVPLSKRFELHNYLPKLIKSLYEKAIGLLSNFSYVTVVRVAGKVALSRLAAPCMKRTVWVARYPTRLRLKLNCPLWLYISPWLRSAFIKSFSNGPLRPNYWRNYWNYFQSRGCWIDCARTTTCF